MHAICRESYAIRQATHQVCSEAPDRVADRACRNVVSDRSPHSRETRAASVRLKPQIIKSLRREIAF
eukprot:5297475-Lingulodinium_polyedra.AAC.1